MSDTIDLLETIGSDSALRHASPWVLAQMLEAEDASEGLQQYVASGDSTKLAAELGLVKMHGEHSSQTGAHEGDHDADADDDDDDGCDDESSDESSNVDDNRTD